VRNGIAVFAAGLSHLVLVRRIASTVTVWRAIRRNTMNFYIIDVTPEFQQATNRMALLQLGVVDDVLILF
jgi:hypothetical protein